MASKFKRAVCPACHKSLKRHDASRIETILNRSATSPKPTYHLACWQKER